MREGVLDTTQLVACYALPNLRSVVPGNRVMLRQMLLGGTWWRTTQITADRCHKLRAAARHTEAGRCNGMNN